MNADRRVALLAPGYSAVQPLHKVDHGGIAREVSREAQEPVQGGQCVVIVAVALNEPVDTTRASDQSASMATAENPFSSINLRVILRSGSIKLMSSIRTLAEQDDAGIPDELDERVIIIRGTCMCMSTFPHRVQSVDCLDRAA